MILIVQQGVVIYTVLAALTFGNHYFRDRRPRKKDNSDSSVCRTQEKIKRQKEARTPGQLTLSCQSLKLDSVFLS